MIEEEMGSEFGSVIIDDVWQRQAASDGFTPDCLCIKLSMATVSKQKSHFC